MIIKALQRLEPTVLKRLDTHLLLHHPRLWALRIHYVLFVAVAAHLVALFPLVYPLRVHHIDELNTLTYSVLGVTGLFLSLLGARQGLSGVEKQFGPTSRNAAILRFLGCLLCAAAVSSSVMTLRLAIKTRYNQIVTQEQLMRDIVTLRRMELEGVAVAVDELQGLRPDSAAVEKLFPQQAALDMRYTGERPSSGLYWSAYPATQNAEAILRLLGARPAERAFSPELLLVYGVFLGMLGFVSGYVSPQAISLAFVLMMMLPYPLLSAGLLVDPEMPTRYVGPLALGICVIINVVLLWRAVKAMRSGVSSLLAESSATAFCLTLPVTLQVAVFFFAPAGALPWFALLMLIPVLLCIPAMHHMLTTIISLPRR